MESLCFFQTLTANMRENCGLTVEKYKFRYKYQNDYHDLQQQTNSSPSKLTDSLEIWSLESEGLILNKTVNITYPELLKGPAGISCRDAEIGVCIIWTNKSLTQTGCILPSSDNSGPQGRIFKFEYTFAPGMLSGDLELCLEMYIKKCADSVYSDESGLINETGVIVGELENVLLDFNSPYMDFPVEECQSEDQPLWWVEFSEWEDPKTIDTFSEGSVCLYLNTYYKSCPRLKVGDVGSGINNFDMLVDILAQTYLMIFQRLSDDDLKATKNDTGLSNNTVCSILHQFIENCVYENLQWESPEHLLKSLQGNIRKMLSEDKQ